MNYNFKQIHAILPAAQLINVILSKTQRKTPTVLNKSIEISRIRGFYMRKIKFTQSSIAKKLETIVKDFPTLADIHPFYSDLFNVLYSKDHYKLALGHISSCNSLISHIASDYLKLLKYGDSQYRCKMLKRAALGRMCTMLKKLKPSLEFLENVRQHMARLPSINPFGRTIVITGFPNVGKSSFINNITQANSDVQSYEFTTQQLILGHTFYNFLEFQVVDTPGLLDHELESRNTIEMQAITALAHLKSCIVFILDGTGIACGKTLEEQKSLFVHVSGLFKKKPVVIGISKWDLVEEIEREERLNEIKALFAGEENVKDVVVMSNVSGEGVSGVKEAACKALLELRVGEKQGQIANTFLAKEEVIQRGGLYVAQPTQKRVGERPPCIPEEIKQGQKKELGRSTLRILEEQMGGPGVFNFPLQEHFKLEKEDWKYDIVPEIIDGKNIADFVDKDILQKLDELEKEEEMIAATGMDDEDDVEIPEPMVKAFKEIKEKKGVLKQNRKMKRNQRAFEKGNKPGITFEKVKENLGEEVERKLRSKSKRRSKGKMDLEDDQVVNVGIEEEDGPEFIKKKVLKRRESQSRSRSKGASVVRTAQEEVFEKVRQKIVKQYKNVTKFRKANVGDVRIETAKPRHLNSGKRSFKADYR